MVVNELNPVIMLWDLATEKPARQLVGHQEELSALAFGPDGKVLASAGWENDIRLWDAETGAVSRSLSVPEGGVSSLAFDKTGRWLAAGTQGGVIHLFNLIAAQKSKSFSAHTGAVNAIVLGPENLWLASASEDGTVAFWDVETGKEIGRLLSFESSSDWLVVSPDGRFDGSASAWSQILWRFEGKTFDVAPVEAFFSEFYDPGLLAEILNRKQPKVIADIANKDRRQPRILLAVTGTQQSAQAQASRNVTVKLEVAQAPADAQHAGGSGVRDLRLFRNGSLVRVWRGDMKLDAGGKALVEATIPIVAGENRLTAYAFNHDNIKSGDASLVVTGADSLKRKGTAYILTVGINKYANKDYNLNFAVADAQAVGEQLRQEQTKLGTFAKVEVVPLLDAEATKTNLLLALERLAGSRTGPLPAGAPAGLAKLEPAQPEDAVFVYFAGHGVAHEARFYLLPHDLGYTGARTGVDAAAFASILRHGVSDLELIQAFEKVDAGQLVLLIDACNSGQALEAEEKRRGPMNSKGLAQLAYEKGMYILAAAQGYQAALEAAQLGHGLLTYALVEEGLKTAAADTAPKDGQVTLREWLDYATGRVPQLQEAAMKAGAGRGVVVYFVEGENKVQDTAKRSLQRPRVFYRREAELHPLVVAATPPPGKP
jgi:uncharacterized caspase-like protein